MFTFEEEEAVETTLQNLSTQLVCVSIWGRFPKRLLQAQKKKKKYVVLNCKVPSGSVLCGGVVTWCSREHQKHAGAQSTARVYLMPGEGLDTLFLLCILKITSVGKGLVLSCSQGKGGVEARLDWELGAGASACIQWDLSRWAHLSWL